MDPKLLAGMGISCRFFRIIPSDHPIPDEKRSEAPGTPDAGRTGCREAEEPEDYNVVGVCRFCGPNCFPAVDRRFAWSPVPPYLALAGDVLVAIGYLAIFFVFKENTFTSGTIEVNPEQKVISTGPYALVRHPMYVGSIVMLTGIPLALGSWWGLFIIILMMPALIWRLLDEERFLAKNLPGYVEYKNKVKYRLVPYVW
jgi:protein-S-isoprenylcysteine O-methyltransferase Ste14